MLVTVREIDLFFIHAPFKQRSLVEQVCIGFGNFSNF